MTTDGTDHARDVATQQEGAEIHPTYTEGTLVLAPPGGRGAHP